MGIITVAAWDGIKNISGFSFGGASSEPLAAPLTLPAAGVSPGFDGSSLHYYVRFSLYDGTTVAVNGNSLFELDGFSFSDLQTLSIGSQSTGAGAGKVTFDPLHLSFGQFGLDPLLFKMLASGTPFKEVDVLGYHVGGDGSHLAVDYSFGLAAGKTISIDDSGVTQLDLEYGAQAIRINNGPPVAANDTASVLVGGIANGNVLANDSDPNGDGLTVIALAGVAANVGISIAGLFGHLALDADGGFTYAADKAAAIAASAAGAHPHEAFAYTVSDALGNSATANLEITIDRLPNATNDTSNVVANHAASGNVLANDRDPDGDPLIVSAVAGLVGNVGTSVAGSYGHLVLHSSGIYSYAADNAAAIAAAPLGSHPHDTFNFSVTDGLGGNSGAQLDIALDRSPVATNDLAGVLLGKSTLGNVLVNDQDPDGDPVQLLTVSGGTLGQNTVGKFGVLVLNSDGSYTYAANKNAPLPSQGVAQDSFTYTESDGHGGTAQAALSVTIIPNGAKYIAGVPGTTTASGNGKSIVDASLGNQVVVAGNGADIIIGGPNDTLSGGNGPDTFVFGSYSGQNTITDFDTHNDTIQFDRALFANLADILAHAKQTGPDAVITYHGTDSITLQHVTLGSLHASDFLLA